MKNFNTNTSSYEAPRSKLRGIKAELRRSQTVFALMSFDAVRPAIHPCSKLQGILAKANKTHLKNVDQGSGQGVL